MKPYLILLCFLGLSLAACNSTKVDTMREDSLSADSAADSMLNEALKADSASAGTDSL